MENLRFATRLNSFASNAHTFWPDLKGKPSVRQMLERVATVKGLTDVDLNYPQHLHDDLPELRKVIADLGLNVNGMAMRYNTLPEFQLGAFTHPEKRVRDAAVEHFAQADAAILCAAVADYRPVEVADEKIKRKDGEEMTLRLVPNPDIAAELGRMKRKGQRLVGFALETNDEQMNAEKKLQKKNLDFIVLNSLRNEGTCFRSDENQITILSRTDDGSVARTDYPKKPKSAVAADIVDELARSVG